MVSMEIDFMAEASRMLDSAMSFELAASSVLSLPSSRAMK